MMMRILILVSLCYVFNASKAQHIQVMSDPNLDTLVQRHIELNKQSNGISGFRVQVFFGSDRKAANDARTKFLQLYPEIEAYLVYQQPNFKVRVGDFRTQQEAQAIFRNLLTHFDKVFIVPDKINLPKL